MSRFQPVKVLYASADKSLKNALFEMVEKNEEGIEEVIVYFKPSSINLLTQVRQIWALHKGFKHISATRKNPDVIHNHVIFPAGLYAFFASVFYKIPLLITEHWSGYTEPDGRFDKLLFIFQILMRNAAKRASKISVVSTYLKNSLAEKLDTSNILITPNVLNVPLQMMQKNEHDKVRALCIGNLNDHEKNVSGILRAMSIAVKQHPELTLTLVGDGAERKKYEMLATELGLTKQVTFTGKIPNKDISHYYQNHDFYILNSYFETFNIATAEALLHGLPVIATRCGGPEEFVTAENGILIDVNNDEQLAQAISQMTTTLSSYNPEKIAEDMAHKYNNDAIEASFREMYACI